MSSNDVVVPEVKSAPADERELLECMRKVGKGMIASGSSVGLVENTLAEIAHAYGASGEYMALPNFLVIKLGESAEGYIDITVQRLTTLQLDQISRLMWLIDRLKRRSISLSTAGREMDEIMVMQPRYRPAVIILAFFVSSVGLTMLFRPELDALLVAGTAGVIVALLSHWAQKRPRYMLLLPVIAAFVVSTFVFALTQQNLIYGSANLLVAPLVIFLPGAVLTTGMIEMASMHIMSGSARLMYGAAVLLLLMIGIAAGLSLSGLPSHQVYAYEAIGFRWWAPLLGTFLFGVGTFVRLSGLNRHLPWMLLVLYIAMLGQTIGERLFDPFIGAFIGATLMALSSELIARSPRRAPAMVTQVIAFWFLVPGARGLLSVTSILSEDLQSAAIGLGEMVVLILTITLGVLLGTLVVRPEKFMPVQVESVRRDN